jgi:hypothetical protein
LKIPVTKNDRPSGWACFFRVCLGNIWVSNASFQGQVEAPHTRNLNWSKLVFKNSAEEGKPDLSDSVGFWKIQKN